MAKLCTYVVDTNYKWYAVYTRLNHEKAVEAFLISKGIEVFLPKRKVLKKWADRNKLIMEPLFSQYLFVRICNMEYFEVLKSPSVLYFVMFNGRACSIPETQIAMVKEVVNNNMSFEIIPARIECGQRVVINQGPLIGLTGELVSYRGNRTIQLAIDNLNYSILVKLNENIAVLS